MESRLLKGAERSGPRLFILRPTIVYGPFSDNWTVRFARRIANGRWRSLGSAGAGTCNLVHGQDVAKAVVLAVLAPPDSQSRVLNINGPEVVTWNEYIDRFGEALGVGGRRSMNPHLFSLTSTAVHCMRKSGSWVKRKGLHRPLQSALGLVGRAQSVVNLYPAPDELYLLGQKLQCSWERATRVIGFRPSISLDEGLRQSAEWCRIHGVVS
jgi:nucleoside-diphosphate-sugar epimerase